MVSVLRNASYFVRLNSPSRSGLLDLRTTIRAWEDKDLNRDFSNLDQLMHSNLWIDVQFKLSWRSESERQIRQRARRGLFCKKKTLSTFYGVNLGFKKCQIFVKKVKYHTSENIDRKKPLMMTHIPKTKLQQYDVIFTVWKKKN